MRKKVLRKKGITLVEILLVASIMTFVGLGIYKTFTSGITVWKWIEANRPDGEVLIFFDKVSSDLRNYCDIASSDFMFLNVGIRFSSLNSPSFSFISLHLGISKINGSDQICVIFEQLIFLRG